MNVGQVQTGTPDAETVRAARIDAGLTQEQAADIVHVDVRSWKYWESGERPIPAARWELFTLKLAQRAGGNA